MRKILAILFSLFAFPVFAASVGDTVHTALICKTPDFVSDIAVVHTTKNMQEAIAFINENKELFEADCLNTMVSGQLMEQVKEFAGPGGRVIIWKIYVFLENGQVVEAFTPEILRDVGA